MEKRNPGIEEQQAERKEKKGTEAGQTGATEASEEQEVQEAKAAWKAEEQEVQEAKAAWKVEEDRNFQERQEEKTAEEFDMVGEKRQRFRFSGSTVVKVIAFLLLYVSIIIGVVSGVGCYMAAEEGVFFGRENDLFRDCIWTPANRVAYEVRDRLNNGYEDTIASYLSQINAEVAVMRREDSMAPDSSAFLWKSYRDEDAREENGFFSDLYVDYRLYFTGALWEKEENKETDEESIREQEYVFRVFVDPEMKADDEIRLYYEMASLIYRFRFVMVGVLAGSVLLAIVCFVFLLCSAGHKNGKSGITPGLLTRLPFDVMTAGAGILCIILCGLFIETTYNVDVVKMVLGGAVLSVTGMLFMLWLIDFAIRLKMGKWWRHTLLYLVLRAVWRVLKFMMCGFWKLLKELPTVLVVMIAYLGICILELIGMAAYVDREPAYLLWGMEKVVLFVVVLYIAVVCRKLLKASRELAEGREDYRVDTRYLFGAFREHGENLNSLGQGISRAVAERLRSEHLKTELITNVSHDLKTPLTSIINYANLICEEKTENPKITEYSEVLLRQSGRLKKLLEDLVEASKATTGNVEVQLEPCEVGVLLTQAVGEYQQRMEEKGLELRDRQPEQPIWILADGRHLWRVFDNLLNNICKYAQENTRVYLSLERQENKVFIIFRNMSKYALDISPEELEERFVRGDKSRHMEGNGLGLSIAKSLTELQGGKLDIMVDGDLFKVTLTFSALEK